MPKFFDALVSKTRLYKALLASTQATRKFDHDNCVRLHNEVLRLEKLVLGWKMAAMANRTRLKYIAAEASKVLVSAENDIDTATHPIMIATDY